MPEFAIRFDPQLVPSLAGRYEYPSENLLESQIGPSARERGYFTEEEFLTLCYWKTPRTQSKVRKNSVELIEEATHIALTTDFEELRLGVLTSLHGVSVPTASTILHFAHKDPYPIIDYRALWSLGQDKTPGTYTLKYWLEYTGYCRKMASECGVSMRVFDRALWQYSKENQGG